MPNQKELRARRCCFTGHRPEKLHLSEKYVCNALEREIRLAVSENFQTFITGMARGVDIWAAEIVLRLRKEGLPIHLIAASPFKVFEKNWTRDWQDRYVSIMQNAEIALFVSQCYDRRCFQRRNEWLVDHSARVIAVYNGEKGGTKNTIEYAEQNGIQVIEIG